LLLRDKEVVGVFVRFSCAAVHVRIVHVRKCMCMCMGVLCVMYVYACIRACNTYTYIPRTDSPVLHKPPQ
jgi:hypothetical protein